MFDELSDDELNQRLCQNHLIEFISATLPWFVIDDVHIHICRQIDRLLAREFDRLMVFLSPRGGKSEVFSKTLPAFYLGKNPSHKVMQVSYSSDLAVDFGRMVRDRIRDPSYQRVFPNVQLRADVKAAGRWMVEHGLKGQEHGEYIASGITGGIAGKGWNLGIIDDPLNEQDAHSLLAKKHAQEWYGPGFYTRRQPNSNIAVIISTRWAADDLPGYLLDLQDKDPNADRWRVIEIPAFLDMRTAKILNEYSHIGEFYDRKRHENDTTVQVNRFHYKGHDRKQVEVAADDATVVDDSELLKGDSFSPRRWSKEELTRTRGNMSRRMFSALYMQKPVDVEGHIIKRKYWRKWTQRELPICYEIASFYDTAFEESEDDDYTARTTWGLFHNAHLTNVILIEAWRDKIAEPNRILDNMHDHVKKFNVDRVYIEKRASGAWLVREGRNRGLPTRFWLPPVGLLGARNTGKTPRLWASTVPLEGGAVWYADKAWAEDVINETCEAPFGKNDDWADTVSMCLIELRQRHRVEIPGVDDRVEPVEDEGFVPPPASRDKLRVYG